MGLVGENRTAQHGVSGPAGSILERRGRLTHQARAMDGSYDR